MSVDFYPAMVYEGNLTPDNIGSDIEEVCQEIQDACKGFGTDEK